MYEFSDGRKEEKGRMRTKENNLVQKGVSVSINAIKGGVHVIFLQNL